VTGKRAKEPGYLSCQRLIVDVIEDLLGNASGVHRRVVEEFEPVVRVLLDAELPGPLAKGFLIARRLEDFAFDLAPVARVVAVLQTKLTQAEPLSRPQFLDECSKHRF